MTSNDKEKFCELMKSCIGGRTLDQVSADTEAAIYEIRKNGELDGKLERINKISRNMLSRLKNGEFSRFPSVEYFKVLTHEKANPQNGVSFKDFEEIVKESGSEQTDENYDDSILSCEDIKLRSVMSNYRKNIVQLCATEAQMAGIIQKWITLQDQNAMIGNKKTKYSCEFGDVFSEIDNVRYIFTIRLLNYELHDTCHSLTDWFRKKASESLNDIYSWIATYKITNSTDTLVIATNNKILLNEIQADSLTNFKTKVKGMMIDVEKETVTEIIDLN